MVRAVAWRMESIRGSPEAAELKLHENSIWCVLEKLDQLFGEGLFKKEPQHYQPLLDLGALLDYLSFRLPSLFWAKKYPQLADLLADLNDCNFFAETAPPKG